MRLFDEAPQNYLEDRYIYNRNWSKFGKTTVGLEIRHTFFQSP